MSLLGELSDKLKRSKIEMRGMITILFFIYYALNYIIIYLLILKTNL